MTGRPRLRVELEGLDPAVLQIGPGELAPVDDHRIVAAVTGIGAPPGRHRVVLDGRRIDRRGVAGRVAAGLGIVGDAPVAPDVSVRDHLAVVVAPGGAEELLAGCPRLAGRGDDPAGWLSGGERRLLAWLRCEATDPRAVVLDGAFRGLDAGSRAWAEQRLASWREREVAVVRFDPPA